MAAPTYSTDLSLIDDAQDVSSYVATGGGASALNDETDYFINDTQCVSKNGFTADQKGILHDDVSAPSITAGDAVFIWGRQANRNILNTLANAGGAVTMGIGNADYVRFNVDGSNVEGSNLLSWVSYAVDPTDTASSTVGTPGAASTWDHFGMEWDILGSGSLKGAPNAVGVSRHGRELTSINGETADFATFAGAGAFDADITRRWGILTPVAGAFQFHGAFVMGQSGTAVDFRDSDRNIVVLEDAFVAAGFNEFEIIHASSNVEWTSIQISHLGTTSPSTLTLDIGTFTGVTCRFDGCADTNFNSASSCNDTTWVNSARVNANEADLSGSSFVTPTVAADDAAVFWSEAMASPQVISELDNTTYVQGTAAHHAITFDTNVDEDITLTGLDFTGFSASGDNDGSVFEFLATGGSLNLNLVGCTTDGSGFTVDERAGVSVTVVINPVTLTTNVTNEDGDDIENARVFLETAATIASGEIFEAAVTSLTQTGGTATCDTTAVHGLVTGDKVVIRGAQPDNYNKVATVTVTDTDTFTYTVNDSPSSPATGTPVVSFVPIHGLTNASGVATGTRTWDADQLLKGWARKKNLATPFYADGNIAFAVDSLNGNTANVTLQDDE